MLRRLFLITTLFCSFIGRGQFNIGVDTAFLSYSIPNTVSYSNMINWSGYVMLHNYGSTITSLDTITVYAASDSGGAAVGGYKRFYSNDISLAMLNGQADSTNIADTISPYAFRSGINTVVIWPVVNHGPSTTNDSLFINVFVDTTGWATFGINDHKMNQGFIMYPNPSTDAIYFKALSADNPYRKIKIYDMEGRLVISSDFLKKVDVSFLKTGIYTVAVETLSGDQKKIKFLKE